MSANPFRALAARRSGRPIVAVAGDLKLAYAQFEELETFAVSAPAWTMTRARLSNMGDAFAPV